MLNNYIIPKRILESLDNYAKDKVPTGGFLRAVLSNNLFDAICRADLENLLALHQICKYIYNEIPSTCWGSPVIVKEWLKKD